MSETTKTPWHDNREAVFAAMRWLSSWVDAKYKEEMRLRPPHGTIGLGGADFDVFLQAMVGETYLRVLRKGGSPTEALEATKEVGTEAVKAWNTNRSTGRACIRNRSELQRWDGAGVSAPEHVHAMFCAQLPK